MSVLARSRKYLGILIWIFVFILCADVSGEIVYIKEQRTWIDAKNHCKSMSGNLINPKTVNKVEDSVQVNEDFWIGEMTTLSSWMDILGCYFIPSLSERRNHVVEFKLVDPNPAICERLCEKYSNVFGLMKREFFKFDFNKLNYGQRVPYNSNKEIRNWLMFTPGKECFCIKNTEVITTLGKTKEAVMCNNTCKDFQVGLCGGGQRHYTIYMRITGTFRKQANSKPCDGFCKCIVAECSTGVKYQACCQTLYAIACRNSGPISGMNKNNNWTEGIRKCYGMNQYLSGLNATCGDSKAPVWTSTFRNLATLSINEIPADIVESHNYTLTKCSSAKFNNHILEYSRNRNCNRIQMQFVCKINILDSYSNTQPKTGVIAGFVIGVIGVIACVILVIFLIKKRIIRFRCLKSKDVENEERRFDSVIDRKEKTETSENEANEKYIYTEDNNQEYENVNPLDSERNQEYENVNPLNSERNQEYANVNTLDSERNQKYEILNSHSNSVETANNSSRDDHEYNTIIGDDVHVYKNTIEDEYEICQNKG